MQQRKSAQSKTSPSSPQDELKRKPTRTHEPKSTSTKRSKSNQQQQSDDDEMEIVSLVNNRPIRSTNTSKMSKNQKYFNSTESDSTIDESDSTFMSEADIDEESTDFNASDEESTEFNESDEDIISSKQSTRSTRNRNNRTVRSSTTGTSGRTSFQSKLKHAPVSTTPTQYIPGTTFINPIPFATSSSESPSINISSTIKTIASTDDDDDELFDDEPKKPKINHSSPKKVHRNNKSELKSKFQSHTDCIDIGVFAINPPDIPLREPTTIQLSPPITIHTPNTSTTQQLQLQQNQSNKQNLSQQHKQQQQQQQQQSESKTKTITQLHEFEDIYGIYRLLLYPGMSIITDKDDPYYDMVRIERIPNDDPKSEKRITYVTKHSLATIIPTSTIQLWNGDPLLRNEPLRTIIGNSNDLYRPGIVRDRIDILNPNLPRVITPMTRNYTLPSSLLPYQQSHGVQHNKRK